MWVLVIVWGPTKRLNTPALPLMPDQPVISRYNLSGSPYHMLLANGMNKWCFLHHSRSYREILRPLYVICCTEKSLLKLLPRCPAEDITFLVPTFNLIDQNKAKEKLGVLSRIWYESFSLSKKYICPLSHWLSLTYRSAV